jgi:hypothetical protein
MGWWAVGGGREEEEKEEKKKNDSKGRGTDALGGLVDGAAAAAAAAAVLARHGARMAKQVACGPPAGRRGHKGGRRARAIPGRSTSRDGLWKAGQCLGTSPLI